MCSLYDNATGPQRAEMLIEDLCKAAGLKPGEFISRWAKLAWETGRPLAELLVALNTAELTAKSIEYGLEEKGWKDRDALLRKGGIFPEKQALVNVQQNQQQVLNIPSLPSFETSSLELDKALEGELVEE